MAWPKYSTLSEEQKKKRHALTKAWTIKNKSRVQALGRRHRENNYERNILNQAKYRAKKKGLEFNLELSDIIIPLRCPVLNILLVRGKGKISANSPSIDRIKPELGYTKDNVIIISVKANAIKQNATTEEIQLVADFYKNLEKKSNVLHTKKTPTLQVAQPLEQSLHTY